MRRAVVLMYHAVDHRCAAGERRMCVPPSMFDRQMGCLREEGYRPVALQAIVDALTERAPLPDNAVAVTFDDGFADVQRNALPILEQHRIPATLFAVAQYLGGRSGWMEPSGVRGRRILSQEELRELQAAGIEIGSHSMSHRSMSELSADEAAREAGESKDRLEQILGRPVRYFAYPYGHFNATAKEAVRAAGYRAACSTKSGFNAAATDPYELRRLDVYGDDSLAHFRRKLAFGANRVTLSALWRYRAGRALQRLDSLRT